MKNFFVNGKLTIRAAIYLSSFISCTILGFTVPIIMKFIISNISETLIAATSMLVTILGIIMSYLKQSKILIKFVSSNFIPIMIIMDSAYFILASLGEAHPDIRLVGYNLISVLALGLLKVVRKDNICNCVEGTTIVTFDAKCNTIGLIGKALGGIAVIIALEIVKIDITLAMFMEAGFCMIAHWLQAYTNIRINKDILKNNNTKITISEVLNDIFKKKTNKKDNKDDSIFDQ